MRQPSLTVRREVNSRASEPVGFEALGRLFRELGLPRSVNPLWLPPAGEP
jgi:hypothetical protein